MTTSNPRLIFNLQHRNNCNKNKNNENNNNPTSLQEIRINNKTAITKITTTTTTLPYPLSRRDSNLLFCNHYNSNNKNHISTAL